MPHRLVKVVSPGEQVEKGDEAALGLSPQDFPSILTPN